MKSKKKNIVIAILSILIIGIVCYFIFQRQENNSYGSIKSLPPNCESYIIINTPRIINELSNYIKKHPSELLKAYKILDNYDEKYNKIGLKIEEPIAIASHYNNKIISLHIASEKPKSIHDSHPILKKVSKDLILIHKENSLHVYSHVNESKEQINLYFTKDSTNEKIIQEELLIDTPLADSNYKDHKAFNFYKTNQNDIIFKWDDPYLSREIGVKNIAGEINIKQDLIELKAQGNSDQSFVFHAKDSLLIMDYGWGNFAANFQKKDWIYPILKDSSLIKLWDRRFSIGIYQLKNIGQLLSLNNWEKILQHVDTKLFLGTTSNLINVQTSMLSDFVLNSDSISSGVILTNYEKEHVFNKRANQFFNGKLDFALMAKQKHEEWAWKAFLPILKKTNLKAIEINCQPISNNKFELNLGIEISDTTKHILLSPLMY